MRLLDEVATFCSARWKCGSHLASSPAACALIIYSRWIYLRSTHHHEVDGEVLFRSEMSLAGQRQARNSKHDGSMDRYQSTQTLSAITKPTTRARVRCPKGINVL